MEEIKVGDFIRVNNDYRILALGIGKVIRTDKDYVYANINEKALNELPIVINKKYIVKHSDNSKDLLQAGDVVVYSINCCTEDIGIIKTCQMDQHIHMLEKTKKK